MKRNYRTACFLLAGCALLSLGSSCKKDSPKGPELPKIIDDGNKETPKAVDLKLDKSAIELSAKQGEMASETIHITQGNGEYSATSSNERVTVKVDKSDITITATAVDADYTATITVKDKAGKTAELSVSVKTIKEEVKPTPEPEKPTPDTPKPNDPKEPEKPKPEEPKEPEKPKPEEPKAVELTLDKSAVTVSALEGNSVTTSAHIKTGNGDYKLTSSDSHVKAVLNGQNTIAITATAKATSYTAKVTVTDKMNKSADLAVTVNTTPKPVEPEKPKPEEPKAQELKVSTTSLTIEGAEGELAEGTVNIISGNGGYLARPQSQVTNLDKTSGLNGNTVIIRFKVLKQKYTEDILLYDRLGKNVIIHVTVVPKAKTPDSGGGSSTTGNTPDGHFTLKQLEEFGKNGATAYFYIEGGQDRVTSGTQVFNIKGKQTIGVTSGSKVFKLTWQGNLDKGTYTDAKITTSKRKDANCTVVIFKNEGGKFWGYFFGDGFKGRFCDKLPK